VEKLYIWLILFALFSIIPAGIVYVALWARIIADESRINDALGGAADIARIDTALKQVFENNAHARADINGLQESFGSLASKYANRIKADEQAARRQEKKEQEEIENEMHDAPHVLTPPGFIQYQPPAEPANGKAKKTFYRVKQFSLPL